MARRLRQERGMSLTLIGLLLAGLIVAALFVKVMTAYLGSAVPGRDTKGQAGVALPAGDTEGSAVTAQGVLGWSRQEIKEAGQRDLDRAKDLTEYNFNQ
ncbi:MAG: hypothetical protein ACM3L6_00350 [Deltaproteobacteria bacterium]